MYQFKNDLNKGVYLDPDELRMPPNAAAFIKNLTQNASRNPTSSSGAGGNEFVNTPMEGNAAVPGITLPTGVNYCCGFYSSETTNEGYFFVWNSTNAHTIWVVNGDTGACTKVFQGIRLPFELNPEKYITEGRCTIFLSSYTDPTTGLETNFKFLIFSNGNVQQYFIEVNAAIATNSYNTSFFTSSAAFYDRYELLHLGVPTPLDNIGLDTPHAYSPALDDANKQNMIVRTGFQFRIKRIDVFGRESEHGIISDPYLSVIGGGCASASNGLNRCVKLNFDAGNPFVNQYQVEFRKWVGNDSGGSLATGWMICETFNKYQNAPGVQWYARGMNAVFSDATSGIEFDGSTNIISYTFCSDKHNIPIDEKETARTQPAIPKLSEGLAALNKQLVLFNNTRGDDPIDPAQIAKVGFNVQPPGTFNCGATPIRTITVYAKLWAPVVNNNRVLIRQSFGKWVWGNMDGPCGSASSYATDQVFGDQTNPGFIIYAPGMEGSAYFTIGEQGDLNTGTGVFTPVPLAMTSLSRFPNDIFIQFKLSLPAGKYPLRIASHKAQITDANFQRTSTQVAGLVTFGDYAGPSGCFNYSSRPEKEIYIDCTAGDVTLNTTGDPFFVIMEAAAMVDGYLYEDESGDTPIEMNPIGLSGRARSTGTPIDAFGSYFTDHNGYYFCIANGISSVKISTDLCNGAGFVNKYTYEMADTGVLHGDGSNTPSGACTGVQGAYNNKVCIVTGPNKYPTSGRRYIRQRIVACDNASIGFPGIPIVMTKGPVALTDSSGRALIVAHNRYNYGAHFTSYGSSSVPDYSTSPYNQDKLIFSQKGACNWTDCNSCNPFVGDVTVFYMDCNATTFNCSTNGQLVSSVIAGGGSSWVVGNTFTVNGSGSLATGEVTSASAGVITGYVIMLKGTSYGLGVVSITATSGSGTGATINITAINPNNRTICMNDVRVSVIGVNISGVQSGGRYALGFLLHDKIGRHTFVQVQQGEGKYVDIPNLNDTSPTPYPAFSLCKIGFTIDSSTVFPSEYTRMTFGITRNLRFTKFIDWAADYIQKVDNTGYTNNANPTQIRIYYGSLNEYNKQNSFGTNTNWDFIVKGQADAGVPQVGDVVQFLMNGDGTWFPSVISAAVTYAQSGLFFTIEYTNELVGLINGALFKIIRPEIDQQDFIFYETNLTIKLINGVPQTLSGTVPYTDSYMVSRQLPVPILKGQPGPIPPGTTPPNPILTTSSNNNADLDTLGYGTNNVNNLNDVLRMELKDAQVSFPFLFEHDSPADTWGAGLASLGRTMSTNAFESRSRIGTEMALSMSLNDRPNGLNGLSYFIPEMVQVFDKNTWGNIVSIIVETGICLVICDKDHFITSFNNRKVTLGEDGGLQANNTYGIFTAPERKAGTNYGCSMWDINTIRRYAGYVVWLDSAGYLVVHDFRVAKGVQDEGYKGYLDNKISIVKMNNINTSANGMTYFHGGIDPKTWEYYLTSFVVPVGSGGALSYINSQNDVNPLVNETLAIDLVKGNIRTFTSFTPEYYGMIPSYFEQPNFLSFKQGKPWLHHFNKFSATTAPPFANFYGQQCELRVRIIINPQPDKVKNFLYTEVFTKKTLIVSGQLSTPILYIDDLLTEKGQNSRIGTSWWRMGEHFAAAAYLCDLGSPGGLLDGDMLKGRWMAVNYVTVVGYIGGYFEISSFANYVNGIEKGDDQQQQQA